MHASRRSAAKLGLTVRGLLPLIAALVFALMLPAAPAAAKKGPVIPIEPSTRLTLRGAGYGHGIGMSQYGAYEAAKQGLNHAQILKFYYPGTTITERNTKLRVLISANQRKNLVIKSQPGLQIRDRGAKKTYQLPDQNGTTRWRLRTRPNGKIRIHYRSKGKWNLFRVGGKKALRGMGVLRAKGSRLQLLVNGGFRPYRGKLLLRGTETINLVGMNAYLFGVVPAEMPPTWHPQALQAQAVAARTYAMNSYQQRPKASWHVCDTTACQVYSGASSEFASTNAAVRATTGQVLTYNGKPALTQFSSSNGGWTAPGSQPYLTTQTDPYDVARTNPLHRWRTTINPHELAALYPQIGTLTKLRIISRDGHGKWGGRVLKVRLRGTQGRVTITGPEMRFALGLRSALFTIK